MRRRVIGLMTGVVIISCGSPSWADDSRRTETHPPHQTAVKETEVVTIPPAGSAARRSILEAIRGQLATTSKFRVNHIAATHEWSYVEAVEFADGFESDFYLRALLRRTAARWTVVGSWVLARDSPQELAKFVARVGLATRREGCPSAILPQSMQDEIRGAR
jgi:hypothetical protein